MAFCRLSAKAIRIRCKIEKPDYVIVQDPTILNEVDVLEGIRTGGTVLINTDQNAGGLDLLSGTANICTVSADDLAREILGRPIINTALLGIFAGLTGEISLQAALNAVRSKFSGELGEKNVRLVEESYRRITEKR